MPENDELDLLLDSALSTYGDPGPNTGLEDRVLNALSAARESGDRASAVARPRRRWLPWAIAIPVAAGLMLLWVSTVRTHHTPGTAPSAEEGVSKTTRPRRRLAEGRVVSEVEAAHAAPLPKLDVFPTPQPLTAEERAAVAAVNSRPDAEREALLAAQKQAGAPLSVADLHIPPLEITDTGNH